MFSTLLACFRQFRRQRHLLQQMQQLSSTNQAALASQAVPDARRVLVW